MLAHLSRVATGSLISTSPRPYRYILLWPLHRRESKGWEKCRATPRGTVQKQVQWFAVRKESVVPRTIIISLCPFWAPSMCSYLGDTWSWHTSFPGAYFFWKCGSAGNSLYFFSLSPKPTMVSSGIHSSAQKRDFWGKAKWMVLWVFLILRILPIRAVIMFYLLMDIFFSMNHIFALHLILCSLTEIVPCVKPCKKARVFLLVFFFFLYIGSNRWKCKIILDVTRPLTSLPEIFPPILL